MKLTFVAAITPLLCTASTKTFRLHDGEIVGKSENDGIVHWESSDQYPEHSVCLKNLRNGPILHIPAHFSVMSQSANLSQTVFSHNEPLIYPITPNSLHLFMRMHSHTKLDDTEHKICYEAASEIFRNNKSATEILSRIAQMEQCKDVFAGLVQSRESDVTVDYICPCHRAALEEGFETGISYQTDDSVFQLWFNELAEHNHWLPVEKNSFIPVFEINGNRINLLIDEEEGNILACRKGKLHALSDIGYRVQKDDLLIHGTSPFLNEIVTYNGAKDSLFKLMSQTLCYPTELKVNMFRCTTVPRSISVPIYVTQVLY